MSAIFPPFKHKILCVLGQMESAAVSTRHEYAEAPVSIATEETVVTLGGYRHDAERVVRESREVALDMMAYEKHTVCKSDHG